MSSAGANSQAKVAVIGASGYTGALTAAILWRHPGVSLELVTSRSDAGKRLDSLYPHYRVPLVLEELDTGKVAKLDAAVLAYPHGASAPVASELVAAGVKVVDMSADFRLTDRSVYEAWYGQHGAWNLAQQATYGLTEFHREKIVSSGLVANPGCYPTATVLALAPLAQAGLIEDVVIDAKSGISGAGRAASSETHFVSVNENIKAYSVTGHRHQPEIDQELVLLGFKGRATFVPHLAPLDQGLLASCYVKPASKVSADELRKIYIDRYEHESFVELVQEPPGVRDVRGTNYCCIYATVPKGGDRIIVISVIDNLWKGASGQAVQNLNLMLGLDERMGL